MSMMNREKIVIFGVGRKYRYIREKYIDFLQKYDIVAYLDNNEDLWETPLDNSIIMPPRFIQKTEYEKVILMADYVKDMKKQLLGLGVPKDKIALWDEFFCKAQQGEFFTYGQIPFHLSAKKRMLLISVELAYNGGTMAIVNAAIALKLQGYDVTICAAGGNDKLIEEIVSHNIRIVIVPAINYPEEMELNWVRQFDIVIVNVFQMIRCACEISCIKPVIWWIHECSHEQVEIYARIRDNYSEYDNLAAMRNIRIVAVSAIAAKNFNFFYKDRIKEILPYGVLDLYSDRNNDVHGKCVFAIIGSVLPRKAQSVFLDAVAMLAKEEKENTEFWIVGNCGEDPYSVEVREKSEKMPEVKMLGELDREHVQEKYAQISVVVCASLEETMSMAITEAMMNEKVCITTDATGMADYIEDGVNGFICHAGDTESLYEKMKWVLNHKEQWKEVERNARDTYEKYFTLDKFGQRLQKVIGSVLEMEL